MSYRIIVCGSRAFQDKELLFRSLDEALAGLDDVEIVSGHAQGADRLAEEYARERELDLKIFPADWKRYGKAAGPIRNREMLEYAKESAALVFAFWDGKSSGTKNMISMAKNDEIPVRRLPISKIYDIK